MNLFRFLDLSAIITTPLIPPLPTDGQIGDAVPLSATINYIVAQVNANAQAIGGATAEWVPLGQAPTFVSSTSFTVTGNQTALLAPGRVIQTTNTGGTVYSIIQTSVFTSLTTVTVFNLYGGVLDAGLSAINLSFQNGTFWSRPTASFFSASAGSPGAMTTGVGQAQFVTAGSPTVLVDSLGEFSAATGRFTPIHAGYYRTTARGYFTTGGVTFNGSAYFAAQKNGVANDNTLGSCGPALAGASITSVGTSDSIAVMNGTTDYFNVVAVANFSGGAPTVLETSWTIQRIA